MIPEQCPCGSSKLFAACCAPFLKKEAQPTTPEQLMRSRYTAFYTGNVDYLMATQHPSTRQPDERRLLEGTVNETEWLSLRVLNAKANFVEFVAFHRTNDRIGQLHERSEFTLQSGRWYYLQGVTLPAIKLERNDPCWCGSGRKLKKCHGE